MKNLSMRLALTLPDFHLYLVIASSSAKNAQQSRKGAKRMR
jgi:hypothetical protein